MKPEVIIKDGIEYRWIAGYEGLYMISVCGIVISTEREIPMFHGGFWLKPECKMKIRTSQFGYLCVYLNKDGKKRSKMVHRLIMETYNWIEGCDKLQVNHKDGIKTNNSLDNLEWCTASQNIKHAFDTSLKVSLGGKDNPMYGRKNPHLAALNKSRIGIKRPEHSKRMTGGNHPVAIPVTNGELTWSCIKDAADYFGENHSAIYKMVKRKNNRLNIRYAK